MDEQIKQDKLFGSSEEEEMSDLDGDQPSENEDTETIPVNSEANQQEYTEEQAPNQKLPSFRKKSREDNDEEKARLTKVRKEIRELKSGLTQENDDKEADSVDPQQALRDEIDRHFAKALNSGKKKKKRRDGEDIDNSIDDELQDLRDRMKNAYEIDVDSNENRKPALAKLKILGEVTSTLTNKNLQDLIIESEFLDIIRLWVEPLPDKSLPSLDIQIAMFDILDKLPITGDNLRKSGVGKIVYFYTKSTRIEQPIKRKADQLVAKWSRLVIKRSVNYTERRHAVQELRHEDMMQKRKKYRQEESDEEERAGGGRMHVRIPQAVAADYDIVPQSVVRADSNRTSKADTTFKRLNNTMRSIKTGPKRTTPKVAIEGKDMSL